MPATAIVAAVPTPGTLAGDQLAAVFQLPLAAAAQEVWAWTVWVNCKTPAQTNSDNSNREGVWERLGVVRGNIDEA